MTLTWGYSIIILVIMDNEETCPICKNKLIKKEMILYVPPSISIGSIQSNSPSEEDWECAIYSDHFFAKRILNNKVSILKIRLNDFEFKLFLKVDFDKNISQVWTKSNELNYKIRIKPIEVGFAFQPDFADLSKLRQKIKTYLLFS